MNFLSMEYFLAVELRRNISKAAKDLHITQQTLSAHITSIEKELDCQLLQRSNPLELTYAGEIFLEHARNIYDGYQAMWNQFNDITHNQRGKLLVGVNYTRSHTIMPKIIDVFHSHYPNIEIHMKENTNTVLQQRLNNKEIDLIIARLPEFLPNADIQPFYNEEIVMCVPIEYVASDFNRDTITVEEMVNFKEAPFILGSALDISNQIGEDLIERAGFTPITKVRSDNEGTVLLLCAQGAGIGFCAHSLVHSSLNQEQMKQIKILHIKDIVTSYPVRFGYRKTNYQWKIILEFIRIATNINKSWIS